MVEIIRSRKKMSRKVFLRLGGAALGSALLAACAPRRAGLGPHGSGIVQMVYQDWQTEYFSGMAQQMLEQFHETHPNIHVFYTYDPDNLIEKMMADFEAKTPPDVFQGCCDQFPIWAQKDYLLDLSPYIDADLAPSTLEDWDPAQYKALSGAEGRQFGLPKYHGTLALYYNKDLFDRYQVAYPEGGWTHGDYYLAMRRFIVDRARLGENVVWGSMLEVALDRIQVHINAWGGHFVDPADPTHSMMARPEALDAMQWLRDRMWSEKTMATRLDVQNDSATQAFIRGKVAMVEEGSWALKDILEKAPFRVGVATLPAGPARKVTLATTDGYAIYRETKYPEAAWELLKFLTSQDYSRAMARMQLLQPARASLVNEWLQYVQQAYPEKTRNLDLKVFAEGRIYNYAVTPEVFANMEEARRLTVAAFEQIFTFGRAPVASMRQVSARVQEAQRQAQRQAQQGRKDDSSDS
jgi:multiple sugar transport system substrate-binding protein